MPDSATTYNYPQVLNGTLVHVESMSIVWDYLTRGLYCFMAWAVASRGLK
jgi:hypothetical protein